MDSQKIEVTERIKQANNILVTVSNNPSVDQLAACIGLTLSLNKMGKHATAVFSGAIPSTIEFLQPEKTLEKNTDSLRDFIIALDKSKADKLRYKVEDRVVKIFITPYKTSINDKDLEFSQGDFNVDVVVALGVHSQADLDQAITSHGRILHDATVVTLNVQPGGELGGINWLDPNASSLSEMTTQLVDAIDRKLVDGQIATSFLTGIVAETDRFSNAKTSPQTMGISAELMAVGANQQLVATKLEEPVKPPVEARAPIATQTNSGEAQAMPGQEALAALPPAPKKSDDGTLEIAHDEKQDQSPLLPEPVAHEESTFPAAPIDEGAPEAGRSTDLPQPIPEHPQIGPAITAPTQPTDDQAEQPAPEQEPPQIHIDEHGSLSPVEDRASAEDEATLPPLKPKEPPTIIHHSEPPRMIMEPPTMGGPMAASGAPGVFGAADDEQSSGLPGMPQHEIPMLGHGGPSASATTATPGAGAGIITPDDEPQNAPGTSFLGDQPLMPSDGGLKKDAFAHENETLSDIERDVHSNHATATPPPIDTPHPVPVVTPSASPFDMPQPPMSAPTPPVPVVTPDSPLTPDEVTSAFVPPATHGADDLSAMGGGAPNPDLDDGAASVANARDAVAEAINGASDQSSHASAPVDLNLGNAPAADPSLPPQFPEVAPVQPWTPASDPLPAGINLNSGGEPQYAAVNAQMNDPNAPPPVPPPMMPPMNPAS